MNTESNSVTRNFLYLAGLQGANYILPLLTLPFLAKTVGAAGLGTLLFYTALLNYAGIAIEYGLNSTATRTISQNHEDRFAIGLVIQNVFATRILISAGIALMVFAAIPWASVEPRFIWAVYGAITLQYIFPTWYFHGLQITVYATLINIGSKIIYTTGVLLFVKNTETLIYAPIASAVGGLLALWLSVLIIKKQTKLKNVFTYRAEIKATLKEGFPIFIANIFGNIYSQGNLVILGLFVTAEVIGYYGAAQKIAWAIFGLSIPFSQAIFPYVARLALTNRIDLQAKFKKIIKIFILFGVVLVSVMLLYAAEVLKIATHFDSPTALFAFRGWLVVSFVTALNVVIAPFLYALKQDKIMMRMYIIVGLYFMAISYFITPLYGANGMLAIMGSVEILILLGSLSMMAKKDDK